MAARSGPSVGRSPCSKARSTSAEDASSSASDALSDTGSERESTNSTALSQAASSSAATMPVRNDASPFSMSLSYMRLMAWEAVRPSRCSTRPPRRFLPGAMRPVTIASPIATSDRPASLHRETGGRPVCRPLLPAAITSVAPGSAGATCVSAWFVLLYNALRTTSREQSAAFIGFTQVIMRFTWGYSGGEEDAGVKPENRKSQLRDSILHRLLTERARGFATMCYWTKTARRTAPGPENG